MPGKATRVEIGTLLGDYSDLAGGDRKYKGTAVEVSGYIRTYTGGNNVSFLEIKGESTRETTYLIAYINPHDVHKTQKIKEDAKITVKGVVWKGGQDLIGKRVKYVLLENAEIVSVER